MRKHIRIVLADDHPVYRDGLRQLLALDSDLELVHETDNGRDALDQSRRLRANVLLLDVEMPGMSGLEAAREWQRSADVFEIVLLTMHRQEELFNEAMDLGVKGYVLKDSAARDIRNAVREVAAGRHYLSPTLAEFMIHRAAGVRALRARQPGLSDLTASEGRILKLIASDRTSKEIADALGLSVRTVENHRSNICAKLGIRGSHALLKFAFDHRSEL